MIENTRAKQLLERDYSIGSHQSGINGRYKIPRQGLIVELLLNGQYEDNALISRVWTPTNITFGDSNIGYTKQNAIFSGNGKITTPDSSELQINTFSYSCWIKNTQTTGNGYLLYEGTTTLEPMSVYMNLGKITLEIYKTSSYNEYITTPSTYSDGVWHHIIAERFNNNYLKIFVDLAEVVTTTTGNRTDVATSGIRIGSRFNNDSYYTGDLELCRLYNRPLTNYEKKILYYEGLKLLH